MAISSATQPCEGWRWEPASKTAGGKESMTDIVETNGKEGLTPSTRTLLRRAKLALINAGTLVEKDDLAMTAPPEIAS
jgi:hypothetical protein